MNAKDGLLAAKSAVGTPRLVDRLRHLYEGPMNDLLHEAHMVHRRHFDPNAIQMSSLLSVKTGGCPEDCAYCPQSARHDVEMKSSALLDLETVMTAARAAKAAGATRFCMGAAWRGPRARDLERVARLVAGVKSLGMETCATLGLLEDGQAERLREAGLDYYNHNIDTSPGFYANIISTRTFEDRLQTLERVRAAGISVCCGGIVGMGEAASDRIGMIAALAAMNPPPESVPINLLVAVPGTPLDAQDPLDWSEFVRTIAVARVGLPTSFIRLSAGRADMSEAVQALCFFAGANSIFAGDRLLTTENAEAASDRALFTKLGLHPMT
jgi:biotin synthase